MEGTLLNDAFSIRISWNEVELKFNLKKRKEIWKNRKRISKRRNKRIRYFSSRIVLVLHLCMVNYSEKINGLSILTVFSSWFNRTSSCSTAIFATSFNTELVNVNDNSILVSRLAVVLRFLRKLGQRLVTCCVMMMVKKTRSRANKISKEGFLRKEVKRGRVLKTNLLLNVHLYIW